VTPTAALSTRQRTTAMLPLVDLKLAVHSAFGKTPPLDLPRAPTRVPSPRKWQ
jgi:hypothetical protein